MSIEAQMEMLFKKNNIDSQHIDLAFLQNELKVFQGNIQKIKLNDSFMKCEPIFSHIQIRRDLIND